MVGRDDGLDADRAQHGARDALGGRAANVEATDHADIRSALGHDVERSRRFLDENVEIGGLELGVELRQHAGHRGDGREHGKGERDIGLDAAGKRPGVVAQRLRAVDHGTRIGQHGRAFRSQGRLAGGAVEELEVELELERGDGLAYGRLGPLHGLGARGERAVVDNRHEHAKLVDRDGVEHGSLLGRLIRSVSTMVNIEVS